MCVCLIFACEQNSSQTDALIWTRFSLNACLLHWCESFWNWWPWVKGQGLRNSLLTSLLWISALLCPIEVKFGLSLRYDLYRFVFEFHKNQTDDDVIWTLLGRHLSFLQTIVHISNYIDYTNFILGTNTQQHDVNLMIGERDLDRRWRSQTKVKDDKNELMFIPRKLLYSQTSYLASRYNTISDI